MSAVSVPIPQTGASSRPTADEVSTFRLYTLRVAYLIMAGGLGAFIWPSVIRHSNDFAIAHGAETAMLAGLGAAAALGLRGAMEISHAAIKRAVSEDGPDNFFS